MSEEKLTTHNTMLLQPDTLWVRVKQQTEYALQCGALLSIPTEFEFVEQGGVRFVVRVLSNLARKEAAKKEQEKRVTTDGNSFNPFLPYEEDLFVADISETHVCILNKFNVVDYHLLIITRAFEEQEALLTLQDFAAMWASLAQIDGLVFYNGGKIAGASQRHKHLQLIPLPFLPGGEKIPIEPLLTGAKFQDSVATLPGFPFVHAFMQLDPHWADSPLEAAEKTLKCYHSLLSSVGLESGEETSANKQSGPYNLLATRQWMLMIPRSQEQFQSIAVNSLGFAGSLFVRNSEQMQILKEYGPLTILENVAVSDNSDAVNS
jgi:ATP adenylyltransferase